MHPKDDTRITHKQRFTFLSCQLGLFWCWADFRTWFPFKIRLLSLSLTFDWQNFFGTIMSVLICCNLLFFFLISLPYSPSTSWTVSWSFGSHPLRRSRRSPGMSRGGWEGGRAGRWPEVEWGGSSRLPGCCTTWPCLNTPGPSAGFPESSGPWPTETHTNTLSF